jgi:hypothetical protein
VARSQAIGLLGKPTHSTPRSHHSSLVLQAKISEQHAKSMSGSECGVLLGSNSLMSTLPPPLDADWSSGLGSGQGGAPLSTEPGLGGGTSLAEAACDDTSSNITTARARACGIHCMAKTAVV